MRQDLSIDSLRTWIGRQWDSREDFSKLGCSESRCLAGSGTEDFGRPDAIIFHDGNFDPTDLPDQKNRNPDQLYIHYSLESPSSGSLVRGKLMADNHIYQTIVMMYRVLSRFFQHFYLLSRGCRYPT